MDETRNLFPLRLRYLMETTYTTQGQLADAIGKTRQTVSQYVNGISEPRYDVLIRIADFFGVTMNYLLGTDSGDARSIAICADCNADIGSRIRMALEMAGMKQKELAEILGVTDNTVSYFCNGTRLPNIKQLVCIAKTLCVSTDYLIGNSFSEEKDSTFENDVNYIKEKLSVEELLCQLAEEATELAHAALKAVRVMNGNNPTPISKQQATENLTEEIVDVALCLSLLGLCTVNVREDPRYSGKIQRWVGRLKEKYGE